VKSSNQSVIPDSSLSTNGSSGNYTFALLIAPTTPPAQLTVTVTATLFTGGSTSESFTVTITP
jgi:hypothetical protein